MTDRQEQERDLLRRRALGWSPTLVRTGPGLGRDLVLEDRAGGRDLARVEGAACLGQSLELALTTLAGSDPFDTSFGFDGINAIVEEHDPLLARERVRIGVVAVLRAEPRVRRVLDLDVGDPADTARGIESYRTASVRAAFEAITGDRASIDVGSVVGRG